MQARGRSALSLADFAEDCERHAEQLARFSKLSLAAQQVLLQSPPPENAVALAAALTEAEACMHAGQGVEAAAAAEKDASVAEGLRRNGLMDARAPKWARTALRITRAAVKMVHRTQEGLIRMVEPKRVSSVATSLARMSTRLAAAVTSRSMKVWPAALEKEDSTSPA